MGCNYAETPGMNRASRAGLCMSCACALANWNAIEFSGSLRLTLLLSFGTSKSLSHVFQSSTIPICSRQLHARYTSQRAHTVHAMEVTWLILRLVPSREHRLVHLRHKDLWHKYCDDYESGEKAWQECLPRSRQRVTFGKKQDHKQYKTFW